MIFLNILFFINLFFIVKDDYKYREVLLWQLLLLVLFSFSFVNEINIFNRLISAFSTVGIMFMLSFLIENYIVYIKSRFTDIDINNTIVIGEGDYPLFFIIGLIFEIQEILLCIFLMAIFSLIHHLIYIKLKKDEVPLIPSIAYSIVCVIVIKNFYSVDFLINL